MNSTISFTEIMRPGFIRHIAIMPWVSGFRLQAGTLHTVHDFAWHQTEGMRAAFFRIGQRTWVPLHLCCHAN